MAQPRGGISRSAPKHDRHLPRQNTRDQSRRSHPSSPAPGTNTHDPSSLAHQSTMQNGHATFDASPTDRPSRSTASRTSTAHWTWWASASAHEHAQHLTTPTGNGYATLS